MLQTKESHLLRKAIRLMHTSNRMVQVVIRDGQWVLTLEQKRGDRVRAMVAGSSINMLDSEMYHKRSLSF